ncbi:MAG: phytoene/squalene synthase family protein [Bacteroidia bacterium]|nr:phytoene/squalene synthase family protein [Bacteroidia bacterium]MDW8345551.1 phytoene/squalene synthase family protein [Bacteroidia bacterium]
MNALSLYSQCCAKIAKLVTKEYSTSFSRAIHLLHPSLHKPIYGIYGFVRLADEIVDTFYHQNQNVIFREFCQEVEKALRLKFSLNPVLHAFQEVVHAYNIPREYIDAFLHSMELDLTKHEYTDDEVAIYIYGSAEVVGLMCLCVFVPDFEEREKLIPYAKKLGSAFQKVNFLRDIQADLQIRKRIYIPKELLENGRITENTKKRYEEILEQEFQEAQKGIELLPKSCRKGVQIAHTYFYALFRKIQRKSVQEVLEKRIRINNFHKLTLLARASLMW